MSAGTQPTEMVLPRQLLVISIKLVSLLLIKSHQTYLKVSMRRIIALSLYPIVYWIVIKVICPT